MTEGLCAAYGWRFEEVLAMPLATVLVFWTALRIREGGHWAEPSYAEAEWLAELDADQKKS